MESAEEEIDIECDFDPGTIGFKAGSLAVDVLKNKDWTTQQQQVGLKDIDVESRQLIIDMLEDDVKVSSTTKTNKAMKSTSRQVVLSDDERALFEMGVEMYGQSWKQIATLLPFRSTDEVRRFGVQYFKKKERAKKKLLETSSKLGINGASTTDRVPESAVTSANTQHIQCTDSLETSCSCSNECACSKNEVSETFIEDSTEEDEDVIVTVDNEIISVDDAYSHPEPKLTIDTGQGSVTTTQSSSESEPEELYSGELMETSVVATPSKMDYGVLNSNGELVPMPPPEKEVVISDKSCISEQEHLVNSEFFDQRASKTPERYLKIRNYILERWESTKPTYLNKTKIRTGLKNCGDVNCIGRIHAFLEQLGAINFGCPQAVYQRMALSSSVTYSKVKLSSQSERKTGMLEIERNIRKRKRKPPPKGSPYVEGTTYVHGSDEELPHTIVRTTTKPDSTSSKNISLDSFTLITCADFDDDRYKCPYKVIMESPAAIVMDIHAHLCKTEVIGLLGGHYNEEDGVLNVVRAEPCSSTSTSMHCDMDPVSQTEAGQAIEQCGLQVVGWYHSHPTFVPNPSQQDIDSQRIFQTWFSSGGNNFLGIIISPYNTTNHSPNSEIRCFTTYKDKTKGTSIPFKFDYEVQTTPGSVELCNLVPRVKKLLIMYQGYQHQVDLLDTYRSNSELSSLEKLMLSLKDHLQTADPSRVDSRLILEDLHFIITNHCQ